MDGSVGTFPWWTDEDWKARFLRPLSSLYLWGQHTVFGEWSLGYHMVGLALQLGAMVVIGFYVYHSYHRASSKTEWGQFLKRIGSIYVVTLLAAASILLVLDKFPWDGLGVALGRTVVVAFPASFAATIFDSLDVVKTG